ncbi:MAG: hypothetical protein Q8K22_12325 [Rhodoferax sp.]|jgi:hypothetical protein|nr:hypothetical protein [Rhodoferax sp.]
MRKIIERAREPSTWAGVAALVEGLKFIFPAHAAALVGVQALLGGLAVILRESGGVK